MNWLTTLAATSKINPSDIGYQGVTNANDPLSGVLNTIYAWSAIIAIIVIVIAGYYYVVSAGDASKVKRAKDAILAAVVGLVVVASAFIITQFVLARAIG